MNKILQGVLILSKENSKILMKEGEVNLSIEGNNVKVYLDENNEIKYEIKDNFKYVDVELFDSNKLYLQEESYNKLMNGEEVYTTSGVVKKTEDGFICKPTNQTKISMVVYQ